MIDGAHRPDAETIALTDQRQILEKWLRALVEQKGIHILPPTRRHHTTGKLLLAFQIVLPAGQPSLLSVTTDDGKGRQSAQHPRVFRGIQCFVTFLVQVPEEMAG